MNENARQRKCVFFFWNMNTMWIFLTSQTNHDQILLKRSEIPLFNEKQSYEKKKNPKMNSNVYDFCVTKSKNAN